MSSRVSARVLLAVSLWAIAAAGGAGQSKTEDLREIRIRYGTYTPPAVSISVKSNLVELGVTIMDRNGQPVSGMAASDFEVSDNGKPQQIAFFSEERAEDRPPSVATTAPASSPRDATAHPPSGASETRRARYIALFIDDDHSELTGLRQTQLAAEDLVSTALRPSDHVAIFTTSGAVTVDFTTDAKILRAALEQLKPHVYADEAALTSCPALTSYQAYVIQNQLDLKAKQVAVAEAVACHCPRGGGSQCEQAQNTLVQDLAGSVWDQTKQHSTAALDVLKIAVQQLAHASGDRILLLVSPGFPTGGMEQQTSAIIDIALLNHIVINSIDSEGLLTEGESPERDRVDEAMRTVIVTSLLSESAAASGGQFIQNNNDITGSLRSLATVPEVSYLLGFAPPAKPDGKYHHLKVRLKNGEAYKVQAREGYFSTETSVGSAQKLIDKEVAANEELDQIPIVVRVSSAREENGQFTIGVVTTIDIKQLKFAKQDQRSVQQLTFVTVLRDSRGDYVKGVQAVMDLLLTPQRLASLRTKGVTETLSLAAPRGSYEVREVVREAMEDHLAASTASVECQ